MESGKNKSIEDECIAKINDSLFKSAQLSILFLIFYLLYL